MSSPGTNGVIPSLFFSLKYEYPSTNMMHNSRHETRTPSKMGAAQDASARPGLTRPTEMPAFASPPPTDPNRKSTYPSMPKLRTAEA